MAKLSALLEAHPAPWVIAPLKGKYYGTKVIDSAGNEVFSMGQHCHSGELAEPSIRQLEQWPRYTTETRDDHICDLHWECAGDFNACEELIELVNTFSEE